MSCLRGTDFLFLAVESPAAVQHRILRPPRDKTLAAHLITRYEQRSLSSCPCGIAYEMLMNKSSSLSTGEGGGNARINVSTRTDR